MPATNMGWTLSKEQGKYSRLFQQLLKPAGCQVKKWNLTKLLKTVKSYCLWFRDKGSLDLEVWGKVGQKLKWYQENGASVGNRNLLIWSLVGTALIPIHTRNPHDQENLDKKKGSMGQQQA